MVLIIGGAAQGKKRYAEENYPDARLFLLNDWAKKLFDDGKDPLKELDPEMLRSEDLVVITEEVGNGIVPLDKAEREFRECIGRLQVETAAKAKEVIRVICGLGIKIK